MRSRVKLHAGEFSVDRGSINGTQGFRKLCRGNMVIYGYEHAKVDLDLVCWAWFADIMGVVPSGSAPEAVNVTNDRR